MELVLNTNEYRATITGADEATGFTLHWHDYIVNEWSEWYATLPQALLRLATLEHSSVTHAGLAHNDDTFPVLADAFLKGAVYA